MPRRDSRFGAAADRPLSLHAATKRANEPMAHSYGAFHGRRNIVVVDLAGDSGGGRFARNRGAESLANGNHAA